MNEDKIKCKKCGNEYECFCEHCGKEFKDCNCDDFYSDSQWICTDCDLDLAKNCKQYGSCEDFDLCPCKHYGNMNNIYEKNEKFRQKIGKQLKEDFIQPNMNEFEKRMEKLMEEREIRESIICPYCSSKQDNDDNQYPVTYWGDEGDVDYDCLNCEKTFLVTEKVTREYETSEK